MCLIRGEVVEYTPIFVSCIFVLYIPVPCIFVLCAVPLYSRAVTCADYVWCAVFRRRVVSDVRVPCSIYRVRTCVVFYAPLLNETVVLASKECVYVYECIRVGCIEWW